MVLTWLKVGTDVGWVLALYRERERGIHMVESWNQCWVGTGFGWSELVISFRFC
jgi:hypothetical protein